MPTTTTIIPILGAQYLANPKDATASLTEAEKGARTIALLQKVKDAEVASDEPSVKIEKPRGPRKKFLFALDGIDTKEDKASYLIRVSGSYYKAIRDHVEDEDKTLNESFTVNGTIPILINESGLYSLIFSSKLDKAREFKRWELGVINYEL